MNGWLLKTTSFSLAALYALVAACGHALHQHSCCYLSIAGQAAADGAATVGCNSCRHHRHAASQGAQGAQGAQEPRADEQPAPSDDVAAPTARCTSQQEHDPHSCAACQAISHLKTGRSSPAAFMPALTAVAECVVFYDASRVAACLRHFSARAPPSELFA